MADITPSADQLVGICHSHVRVLDPAPVSRGSRRFSPAGRSGRPMRDVLVADDDLAAARIHRRLVERVDGFRVAGVAHTGAQSLSSDSNRLKLEVGKFLSSVRAA